MALFEAIPFSGFGMATDAAELAGFLYGILFVLEFFAYTVAIAAYVVHALGLYTIAKRRGLKRPWMAWVPLTVLWILGSVADQYQYIVEGKIRNRRKSLLGLGIALTALYLAFTTVFTMLMAEMMRNANALENMPQEQMLELFLPYLLAVLGIFALMMIVAIIQTVIIYICYHKLYSSCIPKCRTLFTVLGIIFSTLPALFVFICRRKDLGMPPRKTEVVYRPIPPAQPDPEDWGAL